MNQANPPLPRIFCLGETVLDLIFQDGVLLGAKAGGSMLNAACTLAVLGMPVELISECGKDPAGDLIEKFLDQAGVGRAYLHRYDHFPTALVQAGLDAGGQPSYTFSKLYPTERLALAQIPDFAPGDLLIFGSGAAIDPDLRPAMMRIVSAARSKGAILIYDPNLRPSYKAKLAKYWSFFEENWKSAHIVKASTEDLEIAFGTTDPAEQWARVQGYGAMLICTDAHRPVQMRNKHNLLQVPVQEVQVLSAIGAGDSFNAGIAYGIARRQIQAGDLQGIDPVVWQEMIGFASRVAAQVCQSMDNSLRSEQLNFLGD